MQKTQDERRQPLVVSILIVAVVVAVLVGAVWALVEAARVVPSLVASFVTGLLAIAGLVLARVYETRQKIEQERRERLAPIYDRLLKLIYAIAQSRASDRKTIETLEELSRLLILWGTPAMVRAFTLWRVEVAQIEDDHRAMMQALERLLFAIRADLGSKSLQEGDVLRVFLNDYDEVMALPAETQDPLPDGPVKTTDLREPSARRRGGRS